MLATSGPLPRPAEAADWAFEMKWDGMRAVAEASPGGWRITSRSGRDVTSSFPDLAGPLGLGDLGGRLGDRRVILDGEIVATDADGKPSFARLQQRMHVARPDARLVAAVPVAFLVFDLLDLDGLALVDLPWRERRRLLDALELTASGPGGSGATAPPGEPVGGCLQVPPVIVGDAEQAWSVAESLDLEGVVAKLVDSRYQPGRRSPSWRKIKRIQVLEVVVVGWAPGEGRRRDTVGALVLAVPTHQGELVTIGRVGTGFTDAALDQLQATLAPLARSRAPVVDPPTGLAGRGIRWVDPVLVGEVSFAEWTPTANLRHPVWRGLRPDKSPDDLEPIDPTRLADLN
jgi:bifunctional non-homologous end joining protein LigD